MRTRVPGPLALALLGLLGVETCRADLIISMPAPQRNDRFYVGADRAFVADGYDLSGIGKVTTPNPGNPVTTGRFATLISPHFALAAYHATPLPGDTLTFVAGNSPSSPQVTGVVTDFETIGGVGNSDLQLLRFDTPVTGVATYAIAQDDQAAITGQPIFVYGQPALVGTNNIDGIFDNVPDDYNTYAYLFDYNTQNGNPNEARLSPGDSGAPSYVIGTDGNLALSGIHAFEYDAQPGLPLDGSGDTYVPHYLPEIVSRVAALDAQFGYADTVRVVPVRTLAVPEPGGMALMAIGLGAMAVARRLTRPSRPR